MKMLISDALTTKNELAAAIRTQQGSIRFAVNYGETTTDGRVDEAQAQERFDVYLEKLEKLFLYSQELNGVIDAANKKYSISDKARELANIKVLLELVGAGMPQCVSKTWLEKIGATPDGLPIVEKKEFRPWIGKVALKAKLNALRARKRDLLADIRHLDNTTYIEVSFEHADLDALYD